MASFFKHPKKHARNSQSKSKLPPNCECCHRKFGLFVKRHQCSKCKQIVCDHCSPKKHLHDHRVCTKCNPSSKPAPTTPARTSASTPAKVTEWRCVACGFMNEPNHHACFACSTPKQESAPKPKESHVLDGALLKWWCAVCTFENQLLDTAKVDGKAGERVIAPNSSGHKDHAMIKSHNEDGSFNLLFDNLDIRLHVSADQLQREAPEPKCRICNSPKPEFSYPFWSCPNCTLANILSRAKCELCQSARPAAGPALQRSQEQARDADVLLVRDSAPTPVKRPGDFTLLASDMAELQKQIDLVKKVLTKQRVSVLPSVQEKPAATSTETPATTEQTQTQAQSQSETETKGEAAPPAAADVKITEHTNEQIAEAILHTIASTEPEKKEKKKVKKGVRFGFADAEPAVPTSRLAYARANTLNPKKKTKVMPQAGGKKQGARGKFAITLKSEWLEAEMNVQKMMTEWDTLNKKALALSKVEEKKEETTTTTETPAASETPATTATSDTPAETTLAPSATQTPSESPATSMIAEYEDEEHAHFKKLQEAFSSMSEEEKETERRDAAADKAEAAAEEAREAKAEESQGESTSESASTPATESAPATTETASTETTSAASTETAPAAEPTATEAELTTVVTGPESSLLPSEVTSPSVETSTTDFSKQAFAAPYASFEPTPEPSPASTPRTREKEEKEIQHDDDEKSSGQGELSLERELFAYLEGNKDRMKAFSAHSQKYAQGKMTAFLYYYMVGKTFGDELVPIVLPLLLKALANDPKKQEALRCYHLFAISKGCGKCNKIVYLPEEVRFADKSWHRWCFKCMECNVTLDLKHALSKKGKIYCGKHVPKE